MNYIRLVTTNIIHNVIQNIKYLLHAIPHTVLGILSLSDHCRHADYDPAYFTINLLYCSCGKIIYPAPRKLPNLHLLSIACVPVVKALGLKIDYYVLGDQYAVISIPHYDSHYLVVNVVGANLRLAIGHKAWDVSLADPNYQQHIEQIINNL